MAQGYFEGRQPPAMNRMAAARPVEPAVLPTAAARVGRLVNITGALLSVGLLAGVGVWSYKLMVRDVTGVPVIRALAGPMRVSPEDPGGRQAAYQGLAVNTVAAEGGAGAAPQEIALAPQPVDLQSEDRPTAMLSAHSAAPIATPDALAMEELLSGIAPAGEPVIGALLASADSAAPQMMAAMAEAQPALQILPASVPGIARSPLPRGRSTPNRSVAATPVQVAVPNPAPAAAAAPAPVQLAALTPPPGTAPGTASDADDQQAEALLQELVTRLGAPRVTEIDPGTLTPGTRLVQLGVYDDEASARAAWETITQRFPAFLESRGRIVEPATSGGRVFYRLRADGFADEPEARRFCSMLVAESIDCIPALIR